MRIPTSQRIRAIFGLGLVAAALGSSAAAEPVPALRAPGEPAAEAVPGEPVPAEQAAVDEALAAEVERAIAALDDDDFATRGKAIARLEKWAGEPRLSVFLSARFARALHGSKTTIEVRDRIEALARRLPAAPLDVTEFDRSQIVPLLDQLGSDSSVERASAQGRLSAMLERVELISPLWMELKRRAEDPGLTAASRRELEPLLDKARRAWLFADPAAVPLPPISTEQIVRWVDRLTELDDTDSLGRFRRLLAERDLLDAIARDDARPAVLEILAQRTAAAEDGAAKATLDHLADFARPAMAAEVWQHEPGNWDHRWHSTVQYLIIGLPQFNELAQRPTHFDRIDETTAHCVTGNSLNEGDYPVRVAIGHPDPNHEVMFYLTNLPTPRRRLVYEYLLERDEAVRLAEISQRTVDDIIERQRVLDETEVMLLAQLDPQIVSRFVGNYFRTVPDRRLVTTNTDLAGQLTVHRGICYMMTRFGTREAVPALEELARSGRLELTIEGPYQIAWIAALAIAARDPWPGVDAWLAKLVELKTPLVFGSESSPELGASGAAILLDRQGASTRPFGLETTGEAITERLRFIGYRFASDRQRSDVKRWWERHKHSLDQQASP